MQVKPSRVPFGVTQVKPRHFRDMLGVAWRNRRQLAYALRILRNGVCDGCALGTHGVRDWTIEGVHLCMVRLNLLHLNTMGPLDPAKLGDVAALERLTGAELRDLGRLPFPMRRRRGMKGFERVRWDEALDGIARAIRATDPDRFYLYLTSRGITNETYYVAQKVARFFGTNNVDNSARLCHSPSTAGLKATVGASASTCSYKDWIGTDVLVFFGSNVANDQPVSLKYVELAREKGTQVLCVNTFREPGMDRYWIPSSPMSAVFGTQVTDRFYLVHTGGDIAFITGVMKALIALDAIDHDFIETHTEGYHELAKRTAGLGWHDLERLSGAARADMEDMAERLSRARTAVFVWSMGITQHAHGADGVKAICNLALTRGFVGRPLCGLMPIRGHSGVQGGAEMGAYATALPGGVPIDAEHAGALSLRYGFDVPSSPGLATADALEAAREGRIDVLYALGGNFLDTMPRPDRIREALEAVPVRVHQDIVVTSQMLCEPKEEVYLLPARTRYEQEGGGTETTTERRVILSPEIRGPRIGEARTEWRILEALAARVHPERADRIRFADGRAIRREIAEVIPQYEGIEKLERGGESFQWGGPRLCDGWRFPTADGKARFVLVDLPAREDAGPAAAETFRLATRRGKQFNSIVQAEVDPLTGAARDAIFMAKEDAERLGLVEGAPVVLENDQGRYRGRVRLADIRPGNLQGHWPELNVLIPPGRVDPLGGVPDYNATVRVVPA